MSALAAAVGGALWYQKSRGRLEDDEDRVIDLEASANGVSPAEARRETTRQDERESELSR